MVYNYNCCFYYLFFLKGYEVRAFFFEIDKNLAFHLDTLREINDFRKHLSGRVGSIPIHSFFKNCQKPEVCLNFYLIIYNFI